MATLYTISVRDGGAPKTGLTLTFDTFSNPVDAEDFLATEAGSIPTLAEIAGGFYKFSIDWDASPFDDIDGIVVVVDSSAVVVSSGERYIMFRINRHDDHIVDVHDALIGKWHVTGNQLILYREDNVTVLKTFNLFDASSVATEVAPARREPV